LVTLVPAIGLRSSLRLSVTANAAAVATRRASTSAIGAYLATARRFYAAACVHTGLVCYDFTL
jgi:hypothetical protein